MSNPPSAASPLSVVSTPSVMSSRRGILAAGSWLALSLCVSSCAPQAIGVLTLPFLALSPSLKTLAVGNSFRFLGSSGQPPYTFSVVSGAGSISPSSGLYTAPGTPGVAVVQVTDSQGVNVQASVTINAALALTPPAITITAGSGQTYTFQGQNGVPGTGGDTYSLTSGPGSVGNTSGVYSVGTTSGLSTLQVQDSLGNAATAQIQNIRVRTNGAVNAAVTDGVSWYLGGSFTAVNPYAAPNALVVDTTSGNPILGCDWKSGFNGDVSAMTLSGGILYLGGSFTTYQGLPARYLAKLDAATCTLDTAFTQATGANGPVQALVFSGSSLYAGGGFTTYRGSAAQGLAKVDALSGALDTTFTAATGANSSVYALAFSGTSLYMGGTFRTYRGSTAQGLAKIDALSGALDTTFTGAMGVNSNVFALAFYGTSLYLGGDFSTYRGSTAQFLAKVDASSGVLDTTFTGATGAGTWVFALTLSGSSLYAGGNFSTYRGIPAQYLAKVDANSGVLDTTFTQAMGFDSAVNALAFSGSSLYVGGGFKTYRGAVAKNLAKVDATSGAQDTTFTQATGLNNKVEALALSGSSLCVGGQFTTYRGAVANNLAKVDATSGALDTTFTQTTGVNNQVNALTLSGSSLYVGGQFTTYRGTAANYLAKIDATSGALDTAFTQATGVNNQVTALALSGSSLYVGGQFTTYRGGTANKLAKLDPTSGVLDTTFTQATGFDNGVFALALSGSSLYVGGGFWTYRGGAANCLAKVNASSGALDTTFTQATGLDGGVNALVLSGSSLYAGGIFTTYRGGAANRLAKVDATSGALDTAFTQATGVNNSVYALALSGSSLYVGGFFTTYRGGAANKLAKVDATSGALDTTFTQANGANSQVSALTLSGSSLYVGGYFTAYQGSRAYYFFPVDLTSGASQDP